MIRIICGILSIICSTDFLETFRKVVFFRKRLTGIIIRQYNLSIAFLSKKMVQNFGDRVGYVYRYHEINEDS